MASKGGITLEQQLLHNAVDTVVKNRDDYEAPVLIHLVERVLQRDDLGPSILRLMASSLTTEEMKALGVAAGSGMVGTDDDAMNYLTIPKMHRQLLRGIQQMQEKLMPGGFLLKTQEIDHTDATRMIRDCTTQLEKVLRMTKAARANGEILRLKEAIAAGLEAIGKELGPDVGKRAFKILNDSIRASMDRSGVALKAEMAEAEELT